MILDSETFPWLKEDSIVNVLHVERGGDGTVVAVIDARTEEAKKIEHKNDWIRKRREEAGHSAYY